MVGDFRGKQKTRHATLNDVLIVDSTNSSLPLDRNKIGGVQDNQTRLVEENDNKANVINNSTTTKKSLEGITVSALNKAVTEKLDNELDDDHIVANSQSEEDINDVPEKPHTIDKISEDKGKSKTQSRNVDTSHNLNISKEDKNKIGKAFSNSRSSDGKQDNNDSSEENESVQDNEDSNYIANGEMRDYNIPKHSLEERNGRFTKSILSEESSDEAQEEKISTQEENSELSVDGKDAEAFKPKSSAESEENMLNKSPEDRDGSEEVTKQKQEGHKVTKQKQGQNKDPEKVAKVKASIASTKAKLFEKSNGSEEAAKLEQDEQNKDLSNAEEDAEAPKSKSSADKSSNFENDEIIHDKSIKGMKGSDELTKEQDDHNNAKEAEEPTSKSSAELRDKSSKAVKGASIHDETSEDRKGNDESNSMTREDELDNNVKNSVVPVKGKENKASQSKELNEETSVDKLSKEIHNKKEDNKSFHSKEDPNDRTSSIEKEIGPAAKRTVVEETEGEGGDVKLSGPKKNVIQNHFIKGKYSKTSAPRSDRYLAS